MVNFIALLLLPPVTAEHSNSESTVEFVTTVASIKRQEHFATAVTSSVFAELVVVK